MTELRRRMDEDMLVRGFAERTREAHLWAVAGLARFYRRSPDRMRGDNWICREAKVIDAAHPITNGVAEGLNSKMMSIKRKACGFRNPDHFATAIYFHCGGLDLYPR